MAKYVMFEPEEKIRLFDEIAIIYHDGSQNILRR